MRFLLNIPLDKLTIAFIDNPAYQTYLDSFPTDKGKEYIVNSTSCIYPDGFGEAIYQDLLLTITYQES